jgi:hypothetical protein
MRNDEFVVGPIGKDVDPHRLQNLRSPDLNSTHDWHYIAVRNDDGYEVLALVNLFARDDMVRFERLNEGAVSFALRGEMFKYMHERVVQRFYHEPR